MSPPLAVPVGPVGSNLTASQLVDALIWRSSCPESDLTSTLDEEQELVPKLRKAISIIQYRHNSILPVNLLAPEILALIFGMIQEQHADYRPVTFGSSMNRWLAVTGVCRYWRETAITFSSLWTSINVCNYHKGCRDATLMFLERSASAPLKVYHATRGYGYKNDPIFDDGTLEIVVSASARFREFHLSSTFPITPSVWGLFRHPAPLLESMTLGSSAEDDDYVLPVLFSNATPCLKKLTLGFFCSWPGNSFTGLTHISLHRQPVASRQTLTQFLDFLRASPLLEELALIDAGPQPDSTASPSQEQVPPVVLDQLRVLEIGEWQGAECISNFLSHLIVPSEVDLHVWGEARRVITNDGDISALFPAKTRHTARLRDLTKLRIFVPTETRSLAFQAILVSGSTLDLQGRFSASQILPISSVCSLLMVDEMWLAFSRVVPTLQEYKELFEAMTSLRMLVAYGTSVRVMLDALGLSDSFQPDDTPLVCPSLDTIHLYGDTDQCSLVMHIFAERRAKQRRPIRQLRAEKLKEGDLDYLRMNIADVEVGERNELRALRRSIWPPAASAYGWSP